MNYYKLINGKNFVGVATQLDFREYQHKHNVLLTCDEERAQYVQVLDVCYRSDWMVPVTTDIISYETVEVIRIDEDEYNILAEAMESGEDVITEPEEIAPEIDIPQIEEDGDVTLEYVIAMKLVEMSNACNAVITRGFDAELSDGDIHHFSLTTQDQLNLITLSTMLASGETAIPYHADDELCKFYSAADITAIISAATAFKTYQVSYFNALKAYVESLTDIEAVGAITYGVEIPVEYQSDVLKFLLSQVVNEE